MLSACERKSLELLGIYKYRVIEENVNRWYFGTDYKSTQHQREQKMMFIVNVYYIYYVFLYLNIYVFISINLMYMIISLRLIDCFMCWMWISCGYLLSKCKQNRFKCDYCLKVIELSLFAFKSQR